MKHINFIDYLNFKLIEEPLPCNCENCVQLLKKWEDERLKISNFENEIILKNGEKALFKKFEKKDFLLKPIIAFGFSLILLFGFLSLSYIKKSNKIKDYDKEYLKIMEIYDSPALGDLEACSIIFNDFNNEKEDL